jgi:hypothetical protein
MVGPDGPPHDLRRLIEVLDRYGVEYLMVGGVAAIGYGAERPTEDADCVVRQSGPISTGSQTPCGSCTPASASAG